MDVKKKSQVSMLVEKILYHRKMYYSGDPQISDYEYDSLENDLKSIDANHPILQMIGYETKDSKIKKVQHRTPMLSLSKTYQIDELMNWVDQRAVLGTYKIDGVSLSLIYEKNQLIMAKTRGNGKFGEDVTDKAQWVPSCLSNTKEQLSTFNNFEVRGELFCSHGNFVKLVDEMKSLGLEVPSSSRNIVAGILGRKRHAELARFFDFFVFDLIAEESRHSFQTEHEKFKLLENLQFSLPPYEILQSTKEIEKFLADTQKFMDSGDFGIDGAVFSYNDLSLHQQLGATAHHPRYKMSFKWQGETATSRIYDILWSTSRLGVVTPVAVIDTVNLSGANISNVTLHNAANVKNFNLKYGDTIELVRSGEVIPKFLHVVKEGSGVCELPTKCQSCENLLEFDGVRLLCKNFSCPAQRLGGILNWIKCVGIDDLSERRLSALIKVGLVNEAADLYQLSIEDFLSLPLVKEKMAQKLHDNIQKSKHISLNQFLSGLGIKGVGSTSWEALLLQYSSLDEIKRLSVEQICEIKGFALKTAEVIVSGLKLKENEINNLLNVGVKPSRRNKKESQEFVNKNFVITGTFSLPRKKLVEIIERSGGKVQNSVTSQTNILLIADTNSTSSKAKKAKELGVIMWDEYKLLESTKA